MKCLVSTDAGGMGLHIPGLSLVINIGKFVGNSNIIYFLCNILGLDLNKSIKEHNS